MYPRTFRPSTLIDVHDALGHTEVALPAQIFKPLLGCSFNGPQDKILGVTIPNMAAVILRGLVEIPFSSPITLRPGPGFWKNNQCPWVVLDEDPNTERWYVMDAVPWDNALDTARIWSFFAAKSYVAPPPPPPPTPTTLGPTSLTAVPLVPGTTYIATIPTGGTGWGYIATVSPATNTTTIVSGGTPLVSTTEWTNNLALPVANGGGITGNGVSTSGPTTMNLGITSIQNATGAPVTIVFTPMTP